MNNTNSCPLHNPFFVGILFHQLQNLNMQKTGDTISTSHHNSHELSAEVSQNNPLSLQLTAQY